MVCSCSAGHSTRSPASHYAAVQRQYSWHTADDSCSAQLQSCKRRCGHSSLSAAAAQLSVVCAQRLGVCVACSCLCSTALCQCCCSRLCSTNTVGRCSCSAAQRVQLSAQDSASCAVVCGHFDFSVTGCNTVSGCIRPCQMPASRLAVQIAVAAASHTFILFHKCMCAGETVQGHALIVQCCHSCACKGSLVGFLLASMPAPHSTCRSTTYCPA